MIFYNETILPFRLLRKLISSISSLAMLFILTPFVLALTVEKVSYIFISLAYVLYSFNLSSILAFESIYSLFCEFYVVKTRFY